jgi:hypothetical protein
MYIYYDIEMIVQGYERRLSSNPFRATLPCARMDADVHRISRHAATIDRKREHRRAMHVMFERQRGTVRCLS